MGSVLPSFTSGPPDYPQCMVCAWLKGFPETSPYPRARIREERNPTQPYTPTRNAANNTPFEPLQSGRTLRTPHGFSSCARLDSAFTQPSGGLYSDACELLTPP